MNERDLVFNPLTDSLTRLSVALMNVPVLSSSELVDAMVELSSDRYHAEHAGGDGVMTRITSPKISIDSSVMGASDQYVVEMYVVDAMVGLTIITNRDSISPGVNNFLEIVPTYIRRGNRIWWFHQEFSFRMMYRISRLLSALTEQVLSLTKKFGASPENLTEEKTLTDYLMEETPLTQVDLIVGAPHTGKTYRAMEMAINAAALNDKAVLVFSKDRLVEVTQAVLGSLRRDYGNMRVNQTHNNPRDYIDNGDALGMTTDYIAVFDDAEITDSDVRYFLEHQRQSVEHAIVVLNRFKPDFLVEQIEWPEEFENKRFEVHKYLTQVVHNSERPYVIQPLSGYRSATPDYR